MGYRGLKFFTVRHCGDLSKIVKAMAPANPYDNGTASLRRLHGLGHIWTSYKCKLGHYMHSGLMSCICGLNLYLCHIRVRLRQYSANALAGQGLPVLRKMAFSYWLVYFTEKKNPVHHCNDI